MRPRDSADMFMNIIIDKYDKERMGGKFHLNFVIV